MGHTMQQPRIQYVQSADGVQIAYTTVGQGPPLVFAANARGFDEPVRVYDVKWRELADT